MRVAIQFLSLGNHYYATVKAEKGALQYETFNSIYNKTDGNLLHDSTNKRLILLKLEYKQII